MAVVNGFSKVADDLRPDVKIRWINALENWKKTKEFTLYGMPIITMTLRTPDCQTALVAQGRKTLKEVNALRAKCGLYLLKTDAENFKVSWFMGDVKTAPHCKGIAVDFLIDGNKDKKITDADWKLTQGFEAFGKFMVTQGWIWGGNFKTPDRPHIQFGV